MKITKTTTIGEILGAAKNGRQVLGGFGLHCFGCPMAQMETVAQAAASHGLDLGFMIEKLNEDLIFCKKEDSCMAGCGCGCKGPAKKAAPAKKAPAKKK